jgi:hypothetical protein
VAVKLSRRRFIQAGLLGAGTLLVARAAYVVTDRSRQEERRHAVMTAIVPALLANALPADPAERARALEATVDGVDAAIAGLPPHAQKELGDLFSLLALPPTRALLAGVWSPWEEAGTEVVARFLTDWRNSRYELLQSAYQALHQLVFAAWYGSPLAWRDIGYAGPPELAS